MNACAATKCLRRRPTRSRGFLRVQRLSEARGGPTGPRRGLLWLAAPYGAPTGLAAAAAPTTGVQKKKSVSKKIVFYFGFFSFSISAKKIGSISAKCCDIITTTPEKHQKSQPPLIFP